MPSLAPFGQAVSEEKIFLTLANQKKELILATMDIQGQLFWPVFYNLIVNLKISHGFC
jgi:hypothetical protein